MLDERQKAKNEMLNKYREQLIVIVNGIFLAVFRLSSNSIFDPCVVAAGSFLMLSLVSALLTPLFVHRHYLVEAQKAKIFVFRYGQKSDPRTSYMEREILFRTYWSFGHSLLPFAAIYFLFASWPAFFIFSVSVLPCSVLGITGVFFAIFTVFSLLFAYLWKPKEASLNSYAFIGYQVLMGILVWGACYLPIFVDKHKIQVLNQDITIKVVDSIN